MTHRPPSEDGIVATGAAGDRGAGPRHAVEARAVSKRFGGVHALEDVDVAIPAGEIRALVGENGAGKSTLGKIVAGLFRPDDGELLIDGRTVRYRGPHDALLDGVASIQQELSLAPELRVIENVFLGNEPRRAAVVDRGAMRDAYDALLEQCGFALDPATPVARLRLADQQKVEIMRAVARRARILVVDEPTATLTPDESEKLLGTLRMLRERGTTIIYVSHFLDEVLALADTVTVLRNGRLVATAASSELTHGELVEAMLGRSLERAFPPSRPPPPSAAPMLRVERLTRGSAVRDVSFEIRPGEILGLAGLVGSGRSEVARLIFGADRADAGRVWVDGEEVRVRSARSAISAGIAMLPESRKEQGLFMGLPIVDNVTMPHLADVSRGGVLDMRRRVRETEEALRRLAVKSAVPAKPPSILSGGNQQKVLFAKWLLRTPKVLIADEPTRGVDVGAKFGIYELLCSLADAGLAVLLISSELEEVIGLAHRVLVMHRGAVVREFAEGPVGRDEILHAAVGTIA